MQYYKEDGRQEEKRNEWQFGIQERQFDCILEQKVAVGDAQHGCADVEKYKKVAEPHAAADGGRVL
jgi:hypothetical protein